MVKREFNTTGICNPTKHYMVDISERLVEIRKLVDAGKYFCINRARQYGKTTTLSALRKFLSNDYKVISLSFQKIGSAGYRSEGAFVQALSRIFLDLYEFECVSIPENCLDEFDRINKDEERAVSLDGLFRVFRRWCREAERRQVLMIDEVDSATNNQVFLDFLAQLRDAYLDREDKGIPTFQSVILAGVTDIKHLRAKIRPDEERKTNSPWNIAADFDIDMSLSEVGIRGMLDEYEADHHTGMDALAMARSLREYTSGYPYLVSRLCQLMDGVVSKKLGCVKAWTEQGLDEAIKTLLSDGDDTLFGSLMGKLTNYPQLKRQLRDILMKGDVISWQPYDEEQAQLRMYGFIKNINGSVAVANRIFEMLLYHHFLGETTKNDAFRSDALVHKSIFINEDQRLNMPLILEHFVETQRRIHGNADEKFLEEEGRERFLTYLAPIINGTGTYSVEEQTRDKSRMDVVVHYLGRRYVVELKIWRGPRYNAEGERQIMAYLEYFGLSTGYMVSFNFNKYKTPGVERVHIADKVLFEATV